MAAALGARAPRMARALMTRVFRESAISNAFLLSGGNIRIMRTCEVSVTENEQLRWKQTWGGSQPRAEGDVWQKKKLKNGRPEAAQNQGRKSGERLLRRMNKERKRRRKKQRQKEFLCALCLAWSPSKIQCATRVIVGG